VNDWYYAANNEQKGPVNEAELKEMLAGNQITPATLVWQEGMEAWAPANSLPAFTFRAPPTPAAPKPAPAIPPAAAPVQQATPAASVPAAVPTAHTPPPAASAAVADSSDVEKNKVMAILAYIIFFVPLLAAKDSPFAKYHANQGLTLFIAWIAVAIVRTFFFFIPVIGWIISLALVVVDLGLLVLVVLGIMNASKGVMEPLPIIGKYTLL